MRQKNLLLVGLIFGILFAGCKKDEPSELEQFDSRYSKYSLNSDEINKENLESSGLDFMDEVETLKDATAIEVLTNFGNKVDEPVNEASSIVKPLAIIKAFSAENVSGDEFYSLLKNSITDDPTLSEEWADIVGKYSWNPVTEEWDYSELIDAIVFEFPGKEGDESNTAVIRVDNFTVFEITNPRDDLDLETSEMPTSLDISLSYKSTEVAGFSFSASYASDGLPTNITSEISVDEFSFKVEFDHSPYSSMSVTYTCKRADKILMELHMGVNGNWTEEKIKMMEDWDDDGIPPVDEILRSANAHVQVMDIKVAGMVNFAGLINEMEALQNGVNDNTTEEEFNTKLAESLNRNAKLVVVYVENNEKISEAEFYLNEDEYGNSEPAVRFVFSDGSTVDAELYFKTELSTLEEAIEDFIDEIEAEYEM